MASDPFPHSAVDQKHEERFKTLFSNRSPILFIIADPPTVQDGDIWVRRDLTPPELRLRLGGVTYKNAFVSV